MYEGGNNVETWVSSSTSVSAATRLTDAHQTRLCRAAEDHHISHLRREVWNTAREYLVLYSIICSRRGDNIQPGVMHANCFNVKWMLPVHNSNKMELPFKKEGFSCLDLIYWPFNNIQTLLQLRCFLYMHIHTKRVTGTVRHSSAKDITHGIKVSSEVHHRSCGFVLSKNSQPLRAKQKREI